MASGGRGARVGGGYVDISADMTNFDNALNALPNRSRQKIAATMKALQAEMARTKLEIKNVEMSALLNTNSAAAKGFADKLTSLNQAQAQLASKMTAVNNAATKQAKVLQDVARASQSAEQAGPPVPGNLKNSKGGTKGDSASRSMNRSMLLLNIGQMADDAQYGFRSIVNNIPMFTSSLLGAFGVTGKAAMGFAGGIGIAAVAVNLLIQHWDTIAKLFGQGHVKTQAEEMEELAKATSLTADQAERLNRANDEKSKTKELQNSLPEKIQERRDAVTKAITEAGNANMVEGIMKVDPAALDKQGEAGILKDKIDNLKIERSRQAELAAMRGPANELTSADARSRIEAINKELKELEAVGKDTPQDIARRKTAQAKITQGALGDVIPLDQLIKMVEKDPAAFGGAMEGNKLLDRLRKATPEGMEEEKNQAAQAHLDEQERNWSAKNRAFHEGNNDQDVDAFAGSMRNRIQRSMLAHPDSPEFRGAEEENIRKKLKEAGKSEDEIAEIVPKIIAKIKEGLNKSEDDLMAERNIGRPEARKQLAIDLAKQNEDETKQKVEAAELARKKAAGLIGLGMTEQRQSQTFTSGNDLSRSLIQASLNGNKEMEMQQKIAKGVEENTVQLKEIARNTAQGTNAVPRFKK